MSANVRSLTRPQKRTVALKLIESLTTRKNAGPLEPALDAYIDELTPIAAALDAHVGGKVEMNAALTSLLDSLDLADDDVDRFFRHTYRYLETESLRRRSPTAAAAVALSEKAFPDGLGSIDAPPVDENALCRDALTILNASDNAGTLAAIQFPMDWLTAWSGALERSEAAVKAIQNARGDKSSHVALGSDAETEWVALMVRLRSYVASRAKKGDAAKTDEGRRLLQPLLDAVGELQKQAAARATRKSKANDGAPPVTPAT